MNVKKSIPPPATIELERFLPYRLNVAAEAVSRALSKIYAERYGISVPEWRIIATLGQYDTMTAKEIGIHSRMHKTKVSRAAASLVQNGLVARRPNADDLRETYLDLTKRGLEIYQAIVPQALEFADSLLTGVTGDERMALERLLTRLEQQASEAGQSDKREPRE